MPKTAKEIIDNGLNNDILSFKKMLDTYSFSMDSSIRTRKSSRRSPMLLAGS